MNNSMACETGSLQGIKINALVKLSETVAT